MLFVTGGAGFIGGHFVRDWLACRDEPVINLDVLSYASSAVALASLQGDARHHFVRGDVADRQCVTELLATYRPRAVIHFAAETHVDRSISGPDAFIQSNIVGTFNLLECARAYREALSDEAGDAFRFVHISTDEVYGALAADDAPFTEEHRYQPNSPYSASKAAADHLVRAWHQTYGLPVQVVHCSNNFGPYQFPEKLIPLVIQNALAGKTLPLYGDGQQVRDWLYVGDHCAAIRRVLDAGIVGESYNVGGGNEKTNLQVVSAICHLLDALQPRADGLSYAKQIIHVADRAGHDRRYAIDANKLRSELGWEPAETFDSGLRKTVAWSLANPVWAEGIDPAPTGG
ncbi:dTDP-glucose 4,6-dehydratase [Jeongeupia sp. HS-3]|uniref:dTDP-glucose 4,6-dehydratase n=1 Tax=Jeongeupia sp. HS-3 TaxID=1009682 RepID=UPI0018A611FC|nr:dTDP-glucose 4,6-dehydratase [Jeongeupia sp. HS-3]BCL76536.1 dTDP-glucose 4,6-dehydratase [Jeongeupia sp. HS-3]